MSKFDAAELAKEVSAQILLLVRAQHKDPEIQIRDGQVRNFFHEQSRSNKDTEQAITAFMEELKTNSQSYLYKVVPTPGWRRSSGGDDDAAMC